MKTFVVRLGQLLVAWAVYGLTPAAELQSVWTLGAAFGLAFTALGAGAFSFFTQKLTKGHFGAGLVLFAGAAGALLKLLGHLEVTLLSAAVFHVVGAFFAAALFLTAKSRLGGK